MKRPPGKSGVLSERRILVTVLESTSHPIAWNAYTIQRKPYRVGSRRAVQFNGSLLTLNPPETLQGWMDQQVVGTWILDTETGKSVNKLDDPFIVVDGNKFQTLKWANMPK